MGMSAMDSPRFAAAYAELCDCYGRKLKPEMLAQRDAWWRKLAPTYGIEQVVAAFDAAPRYSGKFFPDIGNILAALDAQADQGGVRNTESRTRFFQRTNEYGEQVTDAEYGCPLCCDGGLRARVTATGALLTEPELQRRRVLPRDDPQYLSSADYRMGPCACRTGAMRGVA